MNAKTILICSFFRPHSTAAFSPRPLKLTVLLLHQVELLHPVGRELIGGNCRKCRAVQTLDTEQQQSGSSSGPAHTSRHHIGLTINIQTRANDSWVPARPLSLSSELPTGCVVRRFFLISPASLQQVNASRLSHLAPPELLLGSVETPN